MMTSIPTACRDEETFDLESDYDRARDETTELSPEIQKTIRDSVQDIVEKKFAQKFQDDLHHRREKESLLLIESSSFHRNSRASEQNNDDLSFDSSAYHSAEEADFSPSQKLSHPLQRSESFHLTTHGDDDNLLTNQNQNNRDSTNDNTQTSEDDMIELSLKRDSYSMMILSDIKSSVWFFGPVICLVQSCLFSMILAEQVSSFRGSVNFNIPVKVSSFVRCAQFLAILVLFSLQDDIADAIRTVTLVSIPGGREQHLESIMMNDASYNRRIDFMTERSEFWKLSAFRVWVPNLLKLIQGLLGLVTSFIIVISSSSIIELFKDFTALITISYLDDFAFGASKEGMLGRELHIKTQEVERVKMKQSVKNKHWLHFQMIIFILLIATMYTVFAVTVVGQVSNKYFEKKYPKCNIDDIDLDNFANDRCDGGLLNRVECAFDGGDCLSFNLAFPLCDAEKPFLVGDGHCNIENNNTECLFDGGDCCPVDGRLGDGLCNSGAYNSKHCNWDNGDCLDFNKKYPHCNVVDPFRVGNGFCDGFPYLDESCGFDGGDCNRCPDEDFSLLGNNECDARTNIEDCGFDGHDCKEFNQIYPFCNVSEPKRVGNNACNGGEYNTPNCNFDGGDCDDFNKNYPNCMNAANPQNVGNGECNNEYNNAECEYDGGDCCKVLLRTWLGDGVCDLDRNYFDTPECLYDDGDCVVDGYPDCHVKYPDRINDGECDQGEYNTVQCGFDGGDCENENQSQQTSYPSISPTESLKPTFTSIPSFSPTSMQPVALEALGDAFVQGGKYSNINYGSEPYILLTADDPSAYGVLTFNMSTIQRTPLSIYLKLYVSNVDTLFSRDVTVSRLKPSGWNESIVSDSNLDKTIAKVGQTIQVTRRHIGQWIEFDVSDLYVAGAPALPLFLEASIESSDSRKSAVWFGSRESTNPSRLEIVFEVGLDPTTSSVSSFEPVSLPTMLPSSHPTGDGAAIINNGVIVLGVNDEGSLLVPEDSGNISDVSVVGLRLKRDEQFYDGISPNDICDSCEGFGISYISGEKTYWGGVMNMKRNIETENFIKSEDSATAIVKILQDPVRSLRVTHTFQPAIETQNLYRISITLENISNETQGNLRYRRVTLWTIPSTPEQTCISTFFGSTRPKSLELVSNQLRPVNPQIHVANNSLFSCLDDGVEGCVLSSGPGSNLASLFQFHFMNIDGSEKRLASNEALSFEMFYGAAINKEEADHAIAAVQGEIASYSYAPVSGVCDISSLSVPQSVFIIGFRGLNGTAIS